MVTPMQKMKSDVPIFIFLACSMISAIGLFVAMAGLGEYWHVFSVLGFILANILHRKISEKAKEIPLWAGILLILAGLALFIGSSVSTHSFFLPDMA
jgi:hypothetical protein